jgi:glyoxylase-like metal-dependent hydrolase (beta-lactamase superfamily II)
VSRPAGPGPGEPGGGWLELGDRVFTRRYRFFDQQIGVVLGGGEALVIDTRLTHRQARETLEDLRELTRDPVTVVVDTHWHHDHAFGNHVFRPAAIWGHRRTARRLPEMAEAMRADTIARFPDLAADIAAVEVDPPDRTFDGSASILVGGRRVELRYLGRGHTDADIVVEVPDAGVLFAGDLLEAGATPFFDDGFPLDWPETVSRLLELVRGPVVPGHGAVGDRDFVLHQSDGFHAIARLGRDVHAGRMSLEDAAATSPWGASTSVGPLRRCVAQLRGELDAAT